MTDKEFELQHDLGLERERIAQYTKTIGEQAGEIERLKEALFFWLPNIPATENECTERMANDAALLIGHKGRIDDSAEQRGWILLTPNAIAQGREHSERPAGAEG